MDAREKAMRRAAEIGLDYLAGLGERHVGARMDAGAVGAALPADLPEHGMAGREYEDVRANTVAAFGLGDYEWLLAFEADELHRIVDVLRHLRASRARLHTKLETPFFTGARKPLAEIVAALP